MTFEIQVRSRQRTRRINARAFRRLMEVLVRDVLALPSVRLGFLLVNDKEMARANQLYLGHEGSTDVITFGYGAMELKKGEGGVDGDIMICVDRALEQSALFNRPWQEELARYAVHGVLHLLGYDDLSSLPRRVMKRRENELVARLEEKVGFNALEA